LFAAAHGTRAQDGGLRITITSIADEAYPNARAIVGIEDTQDGGGAALDASNFTVTVDGQPATIVSADLAGEEDEPLDTLILMDTSGTTQGAPLAAAKSAAKAFLLELSPADRVAVMSFSDEVHLLQDYTDDRALATAAIDALTSGGNTALYQATTVAALKAAQAPARRKAVILLSDAAGEYGNKSVATREEAVAAATNAAVPFFNIAQGSGEDLAYFQTIAEATQGKLLQAADPGELEALYVSIGRLLRSQYVVTFDASAAATEGGSRVLVTLTAGERSSTAEQTYSPGDGFLPTFSIDGVTAGETLREPREITATVSSGAPRVRWYVDEVNVFEINEPPYVFRYDPAAFGEGEHTLRVAVGDGAAAIESSVSFSSTPPAVSSGGGPPVIPIAGVAAAVLLAAGGFMFAKRRATNGDRPIPADQRTKSWAQQVAQRRASGEAVEGEGAAPVSGEGNVTREDIGQAMGLLISRAGIDLGSEYTVGGKPVSIGAAARCGVRINDPDLASEEARIWVRGEHLMLHMFTRLTTIEAGGSSGSWQILEPGDAFDIGQHTFEFRLLPSTQAAAPTPEETPNVLRDQRPAPEPPPPGTRFGDMMPRAD
jgi:VWFA-related protein